MKIKSYLGTLALLGLLVPLCGTLHAQMTVDNVLTNGLSEPYSVAVDTDNLVYIADGPSNRILRYDPTSGSLTTLAGTLLAIGTNDGPYYLAKFNNPKGIVLASVAGVPGVIVADTGNHTIRFINRTNGFVTTMAGGNTGGGTANATGANARFRSPIGLSVDEAGVLYIADSGNNAIRRINLADPAARTNASVTLLAVDPASNPGGFYQPNAVAVRDANTLWVADTRNHSIKLIEHLGTASGVVTAVIGSNDRYVSGEDDSSFGGLARFNNPRGLLWLGNAGLIIADTSNHTLRLATNNPVQAVVDDQLIELTNNYGVVTIAGIPGQNGLVNGAALLSKFAGPHGLGRDLLGNGLFIADTFNGAIRRLQVGPTPAPVSNPQVGWVDFIIDPISGAEVSVLRTDSPFVFNNDEKIAILAEAATETFYTSGPTPSSPLEDNIPSPLNVDSGRQQPPAYQNGLTRGAVAQIPSIIQPGLDTTVKVVGAQDGRLSSGVISARFQYKVAAPTIAGDNAALFQVTDLTDNASVWYTLDGSEPTNQAPSVNGGLLPRQLSLSFTNGDFQFKARAFRNGYIPSGVAQKVFSATNYVPHLISFGFETGEASSKFKASAGQTYYAPVTLSLIPDLDVSIYGLQFNAMVTGLTGPPVGDGEVEFISALQASVVPSLGTRLPPGVRQWFRTIPTATFLYYNTNEVVVTNIINETVVVITNYQFEPVFSDLRFTNSTASPNSILLGVGWLERWGFANLYDTFIHDLVSFSIAHDTLFRKDNKRVVLGAYGFRVPTNALVGDTYQIDLDRPSANGDGVGATGADVFIEIPRKAGEAALGPGVINARKKVTIEQIRYVVGDVAPFGWLNAGDFGNNNLLNDDVMQVYQRAVYSLEPDDPPRGSDLFSAMDSCCSSGVTNGATVFRDSGTTNATFDLFDGDDRNINYYPFGDGNIDITDVFVTFRRSLDCSLTWWQRFNTADGLAAEPVGNQFRGDTNCPLVQPAPLPPPPPALSTGPMPAVKFTAGDGVATPGHTVLVPISAQIQGNYPLRVLALGISLQPLDGAPAITTPIQFTPVAALGTPSISSSRDPGNYSAAWLNNNIAGLSGDVQIGMLTITLPTNAPASAAYAIHFDHASGSPNGLASFPRSVWTGLVTCSDRSGSSFNDGIPDSWRLRYFGTAYNLLSHANADADGDRASNAHEFTAGTNPNDAGSLLRLKSGKGAALAVSVQWPSVLNKKYIIERANSIYSPAWTPVSTNNGTGWDMEFQDNAPGTGARFYRVRVNQ